MLEKEVISEPAAISLKLVINWSEELERLVPVE